MKLWRMLVVLVLVAGLLCTTMACAEADPPEDDDPIGDDTENTQPNGTGTTVADPKITFRNTAESGGSIGTWWWGAGQMRGNSTTKKYLDFLKENQVSEIYACVDGLKNDQKKTFVSMAGTYDMRVAWLSGSADWITSCDTAIADRYLEYQASAAENEKFYALHLDVEPHQLSSFRSDREGTMQKYAEFVAEVARKIHAAGEIIEWDIPFWLESDQVSIGGQVKPLLDHIAGVSDTLCLMSYRDTAKSILDVSKEEIAVAKQYGCKVICGAETYSKEGDAVSFMEEGKRNMYKELETVYTTLGSEGVSATGIAIHHVDKWFSLKK